MTTAPDRSHGPGDAVESRNGFRQPGLPAFPPDSLPPGATPAPAWLPGVVDVEFRDPVAAGVALGQGTGPSVGGAGGMELSAIEAVLQRHGLVRAEPSFRLSAAAASAAHAAALPHDPSAPNPRNFVTLHFAPDTDVRAVAQQLNLLPAVARAVPVPRALPPLSVSPAHEPLVGVSDQIAVDAGSGLESQWYLFRCRVNEAWAMSIGEGVVIADIDWGFRVTHADLRPRLDLPHAYNAVDGGSDVSHGDGTRHGTGVLGIAGAADNDLGMAGVAPGATLWPIQADSGPGPSLPGNPWANAIDWVRQADSGGRRKVVILEVQTGTFGNYEQLPSVSGAIRLAIASGVVVCVAAGNGDRPAGIDDQGHPFPPTGSILVGAAAYDPGTNRRAWFSNYGPSIVVTAPGDSEHDVTCSIESDDAYQNEFGGTSGATPKVAGTAALMLAVNPGLTHDEVRDILRGTGSPMDTETGKPVGTFLNAEAAVREARRRGRGSVPDGHRPPGQRPARVEDERLQRTPAGAENPHLGSAASLASLLDPQPAAALSRTERLLLIDQALLLLESVYVHRPLKESMYAIRPVQRLRLLRDRVEQMPEGQMESDRRFHDEMTRIFVSLRDLHTNYLLPAPYQDKIAFLPFLVESFVESGQRRYLVTKLVAGFAHSTFRPGVEVVRWNGIPMDRAVELNADRQAGSNPDARHARGLEGMTIRPLVISLPPDEAWELIGYRTGDGRELELRQPWQVFTPAVAAPVGPAALGITPAAFAMGLDIQTEAVRQAKQRFFAPATASAPGRPPWRRTVPADRTEPAAHDGGAAGTPAGLDIRTEAAPQTRQMLFATETLAASARLAETSTAAAPADPLETRMPGVFKARQVEAGGRVLGHLRIYTFNVPDARAFVEEAARLIAALPSDGLILDVRGNGGGLIPAGEQLLQIFTPRHVEPERLQFINTPLTLELCQRHRTDVALGPWIDSIRQSIASGATYSRAFPITTEESCNAIGQRYVGPVVLVIDALCYSTTDIFAAGFQDHGIGPILGVSGTTGAGGANVWTHGFLRQLFPEPNGPFKPLPRGCEMRVAIRQTLRVGPQAGTLVEDLGVMPDHRHQMTRRDLLQDNADLIEAACALLAAQPLYNLAIHERARVGDDVTVAIQTRRIDRLDFYLNDRPQQSLNVTDGELPVTIRAADGGGPVLEVRGFAGNRCVAARKLPL